MDTYIERLLLLISEQQRFSGPDDELSKMIDEVCQDDGELDIWDMEYVSAAGQMNFRNFMKLAEDPKRRRR